MLTLQQGRLGLSLQAEGGLINRLHWQSPAGELDLLRPSPPGGQAFEGACFALVPYSNRLFDGTLLTPDGPIKLPPKVPRLDLPVHGLGWHKTWTLRGADSQSAVLHYQHHADADWPFDHECTQTIRLGPQGLRLELRLRNLGPRAMPAGLGFHPRLAVEQGSTLRFEAPQVWLQDALGRPDQRVTKADTAPPQPLGRYNFDQPRAATDVEQNHCHAAWRGQVELTRPASGLRLNLAASPALGHLMIYRTEGQAWVCVEPVSHATGALSLPALQAPVHGARLLAPGQVWAVWMQLAVQESAVPNLANPNTVQIDCF